MVCLIDLLIRLLRAVVQLHATGRLLRLRSRGYGRVPPASKFGRLDGLGATRRIAAERDLATTDVLMIRVLLAEDQAMVRGALTALLTLECDIAVVSEVDRGDPGDGGRGRDAARRNPDSPWFVVVGSGGRINKVVTNPDANPLPGWYAYLARPLENLETI